MSMFFRVRMLELSITIPAFTADESEELCDQQLAAKLWSLTNKSIRATNRVMPSYCATRFGSASKSRFLECLEALKQSQGN